MVVPWVSTSWSEGSGTTAAVKSSRVRFRHETRFPPQFSEPGAPLHPTVDHLPHATKIGHTGGQRFATSVERSWGPNLERRLRLRAAERDLRSRGTRTVEFGPLVVDRIGGTGCRRERVGAPEQARLRGEAPLERCSLPIEEPAQGHDVRALALLDRAVLRDRVVDARVLEGRYQIKGPIKDQINGAYLILNRWLIRR